MSSKNPKAVDAKPYKQTTLFDAFKNVNKGSGDSTPPPDVSTSTAPPPFPVAMPAETQDMEYSQVESSPYFATSTGKAFLVRVGTEYMELDSSVPPLESTNPPSMPMPSASTAPAQSPTSIPLPPPTPGEGANKQNDRNAAVAAENIEIMKFLVPTIFNDPENKPWGYLYDFEKFGPLGRRYCPGFTLAPGDTRKGCKVKVLDADAFDVACEMMERAKAAQAGSAGSPSSEKPPVVLNLANQTTRGGGWLKGAMAQEEELCYRSTLYSTLPRKYYPMNDSGAIYSPLVAIFRTRNIHGHQLYPMAKYICQIHEGVDPGPQVPAALPVVSVISVAAIRNPPVTKDNPPRYAKKEDRELTKAKIRLCLRMAAYNGHRRIVLGALGCGAFHNPNQEVANLYKEVFSEAEFSGGWWQEVAFAVLDTAAGLEQGANGAGNYGVFLRTLDGLVV